MDAIPYVDALFKEYLMWRGFTGTFSIFSQEVAEISWMKLHPKQLVQLIFDSLIPSQKIDRLWEVLTFLSDHIYSRLSADHEPAIRCVELAILQLYLVSASTAGRVTEIQSFFSKHGDALLGGPDSSSWLPWFSLPYVREPSKNALFKNFFKPEWRRMARLTCFNFFSEIFTAVPLPAILQLESDRQRCATLTAQLHALEEEVSQLRRRQQPQPASPSDDPAARPAHVSDRSPACKDGGDAETQHDFARIAQERNGHPTSTPDDRAAAAAAPGAAAETSGTSAAIRDRSSPTPQRADAAANGATRAHPRHLGQPAQGDGVPEGEDRGAGTGAGGPCEDEHDADDEWQGRLDAFEHEAKSIGSACDPSGAPGGLSLAQKPRDESLGKPGTSRPACSWQLHTALPEAASASGVTSVEAQVFEGHTAPVSAACFAPDGRNVASGDHNGDVHIWCTEDEADSTRRCGSFNAGGAVTCIDWDRRAGKILLVGTLGAGMKAWHVDTGRCVHAIPADGRVCALACSPREPLFAAACEASAGDRFGELGLQGPLSVWNLRSFKPVHAFQPAELHLSSSEHIIGAAFTSDGTIIAAATTGGHVMLLSASTRQLLSTIQVGRAAVAFALLPASTGRDLVLAASDDSVQAFQITGSSSLTSVQLSDIFKLQPASGAALHASGPDLSGGVGTVQPQTFSATAGHDCHPVAAVAAGNVVLLHCDLHGRLQPVGALVPAGDEKHIPGLLAWHPSGRALLVAAADGCLQLLNCQAETCQC